MMHHHQPNTTQDKRKHAIEARRSHDHRIISSSYFLICEYKTHMLTGKIFGFRAWIRIYLCFRTFMKSKSLLQIDLHAFVLSIMNVNLLFLLFILLFILF